MVTVRQFRNYTEQKFVSLLPVSHQRLILSVTHKILENKFDFDNEILSISQLLYITKQVNRPQKYLFVS